MPQQAVHYFQEVRQSRCPLDRLENRLIEDRGVVAGAPRADAQRQSSGADVVQRHGFLGQGHRVPEVRGGHHGAQSDPVGGCGDTGQPGHRRVPGRLAVPLPGEMVVGPQVMEAHRLHLAGPRDGHRPGIGGDEDQAEAHDPMMACRALRHVTFGRAPTR